MSTLLSAWLWPQLARALEFQVDYIDDPGQGFYDETPVETIGGNLGTTLGEQRRMAFEYAIHVWEQALDSPVPVKVQATFAPVVSLPCDVSGAALGAATADSAYSNFSGAPDADLFYPSPLADRIAGEDLGPDDPDVRATFNPEVDNDECLGELGWNYSLEGGRGDLQFVNTVLHEMAHGLGFASLVDVETGLTSGITPFEQRVFDVELGLHWDEMDPAERVESAKHVFGLVWDGPNVRAAAPSILAEGRPFVQIDADPPLELVGEAAFGPRVLDAPASGILSAVDPAAACDGDTDLSGQVVLLRAGEGCLDLVSQILGVQARGAVAALTRADLDASPPWSVDALNYDVAIPSLALPQKRFDELSNAVKSAQHRALLDVRNGLVGTDDDGRVLLSANDPVLLGTSVVHWDRSVRRQQETPDAPDVLLMEPFDNGVTENTVQDLTAQLLQDVGWTPFGCGNRVLEPGETCDDGNQDDGDDCPSDCGVVKLRPTQPIDDTAADAVAPALGDADAAIPDPGNEPASDEPAPAEDGGGDRDGPEPGAAPLHDSGSAGELGDPNLGGANERGSGCACSMPGTRRGRLSQLAWVVLATVGWRRRGVRRLGRSR